MNNIKPSMILIMDGFGLNPETYGNAIARAKKPNLDAIFRDYPGTKINAAGEAVGLPAGQMGNSEVGHLNIGGGRIIYQDLTLISKSIADGDFFSNKALLSAVSHVKKNDSTLHISGLLSDGGVHSHIEHLFGVIDLAKTNGIKKLCIHCFLDGRDVPPRCALTYIEQLQKKLDETGIGLIATISGRYYAMDRDKRWERVQKAYDAMTLGKGEQARTPREAIEQAYARGENDEFVLPTCVAIGSGCTDNAASAMNDDAACTTDNGNTNSSVSGQAENAAGTVNDGDAIIMFNFRPDRAREITRAFVDKAFDGFDREKTVNDLKYVCMTEYDAAMPNVEVAYPPEHYDNTLGEYLSGLGLKQLRIAETEKYAHVTFFFNGMVEEPNPDEERILVPSPKVATYDLQPEMSAFTVTDKVVEQIESEKFDVIILNFANADMVGHTGVMDAAVKAIEALDTCIARVRDAVLAKGGQILLTADHGNADTMIDPDGNAITSHSTNPVPLYHIAAEPKKLKDGGKLADIAPTLLTLMDIPVPEEMTGDVLVEE